MISEVDVVPSVENALRFQGSDGLSTTSANIPLTSDATCFYPSNLTEFKQFCGVDSSTLHAPSETVNGPRTHQFAGANLESQASATPLFRKLIANVSSLPEPPSPLSLRRGMLLVLGPQPASAAVNAAPRLKETSSQGMIRKALWERVREKCVQMVQVRLLDVVQLLLKKQQDAFEAVRSGKVAGASIASESLPLTKQGDLSLYSMDALCQRRLLERHPGINAAIRKQWMLATRGTRRLDKADYVSYFSKCYDELCPSECEQDDAEKAASIQADWISDSKGCDYLDFPMFFDALFELVDNWCETIEPAEYMGLLERLLRCMPVSEPVAASTSAALTVSEPVAASTPASLEVPTGLSGLPVHQKRTIMHRTDGIHRPAQASSATAASVSISATGLLPLASASPRLPHLFDIMESSEYNTDGSHSHSSSTQAREVARLKIRSARRSFQTSGSARSMSARSVASMASTGSSAGSETSEASSWAETEHWATNLRSSFVPTSAAHTRALSGSQSVKSIPSHNDGVPVDSVMEAQTEAYTGRLSHALASKFDGAQSSSHHGTPSLTSLDCKSPVISTSRTSTTDTTFMLGIPVTTTQLEATTPASTYRLADVMPSNSSASISSIVTVDIAATGSDLSHSGGSRYHYSEDQMPTLSPSAVSFATSPVPRGTSRQITSRAARPPAAASVKIKSSVGDPLSLMFPALCPSGRPNFMSPIRTNITVSLRGRTQVTKQIRQSGSMPVLHSYTPSHPPAIRPSQHSPAAAARLGRHMSLKLDCVDVPAAVVEPIASPSCHTVSQAPPSITSKGSSLRLGQHPGPAQLLKLHMPSYSMPQDAPPGAFESPLASQQKAQLLSPISAGGSANEPPLLRTKSLTESWCQRIKQFKHCSSSIQVGAFSSKIESKRRAVVPPKLKPMGS